MRWGFPRFFAILTRNQTCRIMRVVLGLGANMTSAWGTPAQTIHHAIRLLGVNGVRIEGRSPTYESAPLGIRDQDTFANAVVSAETALPPAALLSTLKRLECMAGRRASVRWGPRPLDIDILDYAGRLINRLDTQKRTLRHESRQPQRRRTPAEQTRRRPALVTPHPQLHLRAFVLQPLADVLPRWHHPVTGESVLQLARALPQDARGAEGQIRRMLDDAA